MNGWLAQSSSVNIAGVVAWSVGLLLMLMLGMMAAARLKRRLRQDDAQPAAASGFTLSDLRQMHRAGQLTDAEFERAKEKVVAAAQRAATRAALPAGTAPPKDSVEAMRLRRLARETPQDGATTDETDEDAGTNRAPERP